MEKSYSKINRREVFLEPNLIRQRLAFRGPIPSHVLNLYYDQFIVDCARLAKLTNEVSSKTDKISEDYASDFSLSTPNYYIDEDLSSKIYYTYKYYDQNQNEQTVNKEHFLSNLTFQKYGINSSKINYLNHKLKMLEDLIGKKE